MMEPANPASRGLLAQPAQSVPMATEAASEALWAHVLLSQTDRFPGKVRSY